MVKRIYYKNRFIAVADDHSQFAQNQSIELITSLGDKYSVLSDITDDLVSADNNRSYILLNQDFKKVLTRLKTRLHYIEAAGGFIERNGRFLFIYRHSRWDLPKGKREKNESAEQCAVRECEEECGVKSLRITGKLPSTYHIYEYKGGFALKKTYWYAMTTSFFGKLVPQSDEDITDARWMSPAEITGTVLKNTYFTIADVVRAALAL